jgi:hypothetical protein
LVYWDNYRSEPATVSFANIDGSGGGALNLTGITLDDPEGMDYDPRHQQALHRQLQRRRRGKARSSSSTADGSGGGLLNTTGVAVPSPTGWRWTP